MSEEKIASKTELCLENQDQIWKYLVDTDGKEINVRHGVVYDLKDKLNICKDCPDYIYFYNKHRCIKYFPRDKLGNLIEPKWADDDEQK